MDLLKGALVASIERVLANHYPVMLLKEEQNAPVSIKLQDAQTYADAATLQTSLALVAHQQCQVLCQVQSSHGIVKHCPPTKNERAGLYGRHLRKALGEFKRHYV